VGSKTFEVTENNLQTDVINSAQPVLVDFWAEWCGPCKSIAPIVDQLATEYEGKMKVGKLDTDAYGDLATQFNVMSIPTLLLFKGGKPVARITGYKDKNSILAQLQPHLG
jgi:thioredoxin 1